MSKQKRDKAKGVRDKCKAVRLPPRSDYFNIPKQMKSALCFCSVFVICLLVSCGGLKKPAIQEALLVITDSPQSKNKTLQITKKQHLTLSITSPTETGKQMLGKWPERDVWFQLYDVKNELVKTLNYEVLWPSNHRHVPLQEPLEIKLELTTHPDQGLLIRQCGDFLGGHRVEAGKNYSLIVKVSCYDRKYRCVYSVSSAPISFHVVK